MDAARVDRMIASGGVQYSSVRDSIVPGDPLFLHDAFVPTLYGLQIEAVQRATGPLAHAAIIDRFGGRVWVEESVVPFIRLSPLSNVIDRGFFWLPLGIEMSDAERDVALKFVSVGGYSKPGAVQAGLRWLNYDEEKADTSRFWCSKYMDVVRTVGGVDCGRDQVPSWQADYMEKRYSKELVYVRMD